MATPAGRLYRTQQTLTRTLRVANPSGRGRMVLRTERDWDRDVEPVSVSEDGNLSTFAREADPPFLYFKPCLVESGATHWAVGPNKLAIMTSFAMNATRRASPSARTTRTNLGEGLSGRTSSWARPSTRLR
jgi:hypothetical protein